MWTPATSQDNVSGLREERAVNYGGEAASMFSFFQMFSKVIFRRRGSVLPNIWVELLIAFLCGWAAWSLTDYGGCSRETCPLFFLKPVPGRVLGHQIIGVLLAFLVVFRSQIAWGMYWEGRGHVGAIVAKSRCLSLELLASLAHTSIEEDEAHARARTAPNGCKPPGELALLALESVRLIKLYYWTIVEHVRSTDGEDAWRSAMNMVQRFATDAEYAELLGEFGDVQQGTQRQKVLIPGTDSVADLEAASGSRNSLPLPYFKRAGNRKQYQDPTRAKPLIVMTWLRINIERMIKAKAIELTQLQRLSELINELIGAYNGIDKIDRTVLPLPYCQLLKIFQIFFVFTLPFVIAPLTGHWTPVLALFTAIGFFGLDQVGVELEGPFGIDDNDFPLLAMGLAMCNDLDTMVRTVSRPRMEARTFNSSESYEVKRAAGLALGWDSGNARVVKPQPTLKTAPHAAGIYKVDSPGSARLALGDTSGPSTIAHV